MISIEKSSIRIINVISPSSACAGLQHSANGFSVEFIEAVVDSYLQGFVLIEFAERNRFLKISIQPVSTVVWQDVFCYNSHTEPVIYVQYWTFTDKTTSHFFANTCSFYLESSAVMVAHLPSQHSGSEIKWVDGGKALFRVSTHLVSTVYTQVYALLIRVPLAHLQ